MSLFRRKKEETKPCCCGKNAVTADTDTVSEPITNIKVLGAGCKSCHQMFENTRQAVQNIGMDIEVEYITDMEKVMLYGIISMPVLVVNDKVVASGRVLKPTEIEKYLR